MPVGRIVRWLVALGVTVGGFAIVFVLTDAVGGLDQAEALTLATAAAPLVASPFVWWASQPIEPRQRRGRSPRALPARGGGVFICYSQQDAREYAGRLAAYLDAAGVPAWRDTQIASGTSWTRAIQDQLDACAAVVVIMTVAGSRSPSVDREILYALDAGKPILPLLLTGRTFFSIAHLQYGNVTDGSMPGEAFLSHLRDLVTIVPATVPASVTVDLAPTVPVDQAPAPSVPAPSVPADPAPAPSVPADLAPAEVPVPRRASVQAPGSAPSPIEPVSVRPRRRAPLVWAAAALGLILAVTTTIVLMNHVGKKDAGSGSSGSGSEFTPPGLAISPDGRWAYVTINRTSHGASLPGALVSIDTTTMTVPGDEFLFRQGPAQVVITPDGKRVFMAATTTGESAVIIYNLGAHLSGINDVNLMPSPAVTAMAAPGNRSLALSPDGRTLYAADEQASLVSIADTAALRKNAAPVRYITLPAAPRSIALSPDGKRLYAASYAEATVTLIDTSAAAVVGGPIHVGAGPRAMAISRDGTRLFVASYDGHSISVIDTVAGTKLKEISPGCSDPVSVAVSNDGTRLYATCESSGIVAVTDIDSGQAIAQITVGRLPLSIALSADGKRLYVANIDTENVLVSAIDTATNTVVGEPAIAGAWNVATASS